MLNLLKLTNFFATVYNDAAQPWQLGFQDSASPSFTGILTLHNTVGFYLVEEILFKLILSGLFMISILWLAISNSGRGQKFLDNASKLINIAEGSTVLYNSYIRGSWGSSEDNDKDINSNNKDKDKDKDTKKDDNKDNSKINNNNQRMKIQHLIIQILNQVKKQQSMIIKILRKIKNKLNLNYSFSLPIILSNLNIEVNNLDSTLSQFSYGVLCLSLIALLCFINIIGYMVSYILIQKSNFEVKYPKLSKFINSYKQTTLLFLTFEVLMCLTCLLLLVFFSLLFVYSGISNK